MPASDLAGLLIGGIAAGEIPYPPFADFSDYDPHGLWIPPLSNTIYTRDTTSWIHGGVTLNPMFWPARCQETLLTTAIYKFHLDFRDAGFKTWFGNPDFSYGPATVEGGDVMPVGNGVVLVGMGERTTSRAIMQIALALFEEKAAERVIACAMPKSRSTIHLDTVFTLCDSDFANVYEKVVREIRCYSLYPGEEAGSLQFVPDEKPFLDVVAGALGLARLRAVTTGVTGSSRSVSNGMMVIMFSLWNPVWLSVVTGMSTPIQNYGKRAWRSLQSPYLDNEGITTGFPCNKVCRWQDTCIMNDRVAHVAQHVPHSVGGFPAPRGGTL